MMSLKVVCSKFGVVGKADYNSKLVAMSGVAVEPKCWEVKVWKEKFAQGLVPCSNKSVWFCTGMVRGQ
jgi:hypothetical protein